MIGEVLLWVGFAGLLLVAAFLLKPCRPANPCRFCDYILMHSKEPSWNCKESCWPYLNFKRVCGDAGDDC